MDGSQIEALFNAGQMETIRNYCLCDVAQTAFLFLRYELLRGRARPGALPGDGPDPVGAPGSRFPGRAHPGHPHRIWSVSCCEAVPGYVISAGYGM